MEGSWNLSVDLRAWRLSPPKNGCNAFPLAGLAKLTGDKVSWGHLRCGPVCGPVTLDAGGPHASVEVSTAVDQRQPFTELLRLAIPEVESIVTPHEPLTIRGVQMGRDAEGPSRFEELCATLVTYGIHDRKRE